MSPPPRQPPSSNPVRAIMRWVIAAFFTAAGVAHLAVPDKLLSITPDWAPFAPTVIFLTGCSNSPPSPRYREAQN